ncbi:MAG: hypothetical protein LBM13_06195 [Candidatus Ancillula sp.]|jgi:hypothetical protein|nr:hypothetical protein [Candidatus Ancillula sp.]
MFTFVAIDSNHIIRLGFLIFGIGVLAVLIVLFGFNFMNFIKVKKAEVQFDGIESALKYLKDKKINQMQSLAFLRTRHDIFFGAILVDALAKEVISMRETYLRFKNDKDQTKLLEIKKSEVNADLGDFSTYALKLSPSKLKEITGNQAEIIKVLFTDFSKNIDHSKSKNKSKKLTKTLSKEEIYLSVELQNMIKRTQIIILINQMSLAVKNVQNNFFKFQIGGKGASSSKQSVWQIATGFCFAAVVCVILVFLGSLVSFLFVIPRMSLNNISTLINLTNWVVTACCVLLLLSILFALIGVGIFAGIALSENINFRQIKDYYRREIVVRSRGNIVNGKAVEEEMSEDEQNDMHEVINESIKYRNPYMAIYTEKGAKIKAVLQKIQDLGFVISEKGDTTALWYALFIDGEVKRINFVELKMECSILTGGEEKVPVKYLFSIDLDDSNYADAMYEWFEEIQKQDAENYRYLTYRTHSALGI